MTDKTTFDVIIVGGSYTGLSAAMALGRSLRTVLIVDSAQPCNRQTPYAHNFLTQDGMEPRTIAEVGKKQVLKYETVTFVSGMALKDRKKIVVSQLNLLQATFSNQRKYSSHQASKIFCQI